MRKLTNKFLLIITACIVIVSCIRNEIEFGTTPENNYTNIVFTDTLGISLSTVFVDSFITNSATSLLLGKYRDPYFGTISAKNFFQMTTPGIPVIPDDAVYDSLTFVFRPNDYYYGDTSLQQTFNVYEIAEAMTFSYNSSFYNTSNVAVKPTRLGSKTMRLRPIADDSVEVRLNDTKGREIFTKLKSQSTDITNEENFLNYFHGISLATGNDLAAVYGIDGSAGSIVMSVHYHSTIPQPVNYQIKFSSLANTYSFNQVIADRTGTGLVSAGINNLTEIPASQTNNVSFLQPGTGVFLKMTFPSLHGILSGEKIVKLVKAELYVRPAYLSFDKNKYKLPSPLYLNQTDESNVFGDQVVDTSGTGVLYTYPVTDDIYGENNFYRLNITSYINGLLTNTGTEDNGFYLMHTTSPSSMNLNRIVVNNSLHENQSTKLYLYFIEINK
jgi:hypothetical protein